ncbi:signal peptidase I [Kineococcus radiotolerans]|uniref:Signal peptidase I n=1 Tax=Kineococcus radiotolerans (strain ATCC BAA-149 / DSM 14245 / SRS30216) TaxID=266940 RepID=A6WAU0_KINRD|nr:signal peptidase I [Kineococcus radiotolerans]ABS03929.1 peptidase S26B, signal peptidase [Kineococcus radiotolerans SRS30216 = ATCC BAA-149]
MSLQDRRTLQMVQALQTMQKKETSLTQQQPATPPTPNTSAQSAALVDSDDAGPGEPRLRHWVRETVLTVAALGGVVCLLAIAAAVFCDITLVMFRTGSMSPTIPAGAVAVVRAVPAAEVVVGDVVTVERPDALPVTHRVLRIAPNPNGPAASRLLTLKGDANATADPVPYAVSDVRRVIVSRAHLGHWINRARSPLALSATTLLVGALVTWTFWPTAATAQPPTRSGIRS